MTGHDAFRRLAAWSIDGPLSEADRHRLESHRAG